MSIKNKTVITNLEGNLLFDITTCTQG